MNSLALRYEDDIILIDAGMMFPDEDLLGVDIVTPDYTFLEKNREHFRAVILTHGHEDHIGALPFLLSQLNVPVYATAFTLALIGRRLEEHDLLDQAKLNRVRPGEKLEIGPFRIEFIHVTHSIVDAVALAITTPLGVVVHTGDFKVDPTPTDNLPFDLHTLADYGRRGVLLLMSDSTNADRPGYTESERAVRPRLEDIITRAERRLVISCFSSSVHRMQQIIDLAAESGRKVAFVGRSMMSTTEIAHSQGLLTIPNGLLVRQQDIMDVQPIEAPGRGFGQPGRTDVGAVARGGGQPQAPLGRARRYGGAQLAHHPGQREGHIPGDEPLLQTRRGGDLRHHEPAAARLRSRQRRGVEAGAEPGAAEVFHARPRRVPAACQARATGRAPAPCGPAGNVHPRKRRHAGARPARRA